MNVERAKIQRRCQKAAATLGSHRGEWPGVGRMSNEVMNSNADYENQYEGLANHKTHELQMFKNVSGNFAT